MNVTGHITMGMVAGVICGAPASGVILSAFGGLLPDIDHPRSTLGRWNPFTRWMKHRGWTHTWIGCLLLAAPFYLISGFYFKWILVGCISHILADKLYSWLPGKKRFSIRIW